MTEITRWVTELKPMAERMEAANPHASHFFEFMTAVASSGFPKEKVDLAILKQAWADGWFKRGQSSTVDHHHCFADHCAFWERNRGHSW